MARGEARSAPPGRRDAIDVARVLALVIVVLGHLTIATVDRAGGKLRLANLLALRPHWAWAAGCAPMPVFFAAAGWANATATVKTSVRRLQTLVGLGAVVVITWSIAAIVMTLATGRAGIAGDGARIATQPLWFLAAYVPFAANGGRLAWIATDHIVLAVGGCLAALALFDLVRFGFGAPDWVGWPGFFLAWGTPWLAGAWWRARVGAVLWLAEARAGVALFATAALAATGLVAFAGYSAPLIDAVPGARSNTTPPTLYTAVVALAQVGVLLIVAHGLDRAGRRWRAWWDRAGELAVGVYLWHLTALSFCVGLIAAGIPAPTRLTTSWWSLRPVWWCAVLVVTAGLIALVAVIRARLPRPSRLTARPFAASTGIVVITFAAALVGLRGPRSLPLALLCSLFFAGGWILLRVGSTTA